MKHIKKIIFIILALDFIMFGVVNILHHLIADQELRNQSIEKDIEILRLKKELQERPVIREVKYIGLASYYSVAGCVGCRDDLLMANGERFDETAMTLAFNWLPLGTVVEVTNVLTGDSRLAEITDTGGFNKLGRIADLSLGLKEALNCSDLCRVEIVEQE